MNSQGSTKLSVRKTGEGETINKEAERGKARRAKRGRETGEGRPRKTE